MFHVSRLLEIELKSDFTEASNIEHFEIFLVLSSIMWYMYNTERRMQLKVQSTTIIHLLWKTLYFT